MHFEDRDLEFAVELIGSVVGAFRMTLRLLA